jgi:hypothetical protein
VIAVLDSDMWMFTLPSGMAVIACPCCKQTMNSATRAKKVCDGFYPMGRLNG